MYSADHELESIKCFVFLGQLCSLYQDSYNDDDPSPRGPDVGQSEVLEGTVCSSSAMCDLCTLDAEITHSVAAANSALRQLRWANIWSSRALTLSVKMQFLSVLLYSGET